MLLDKTWASNKKLFILLLLFVIIASIFNALFVYSNTIILSPDSHSYVSWADDLISKNFAPINFPITRIAFIFQIALTKFYMGNYWQLGIVTANIICSGIAISLLFLAVHEITKKTWVLAVAFVFLIVCQDIRLWNAYILSDTGFMFLSFTFIIILSKSIQKKGVLNSVKRWLGVVIVLAIAFLYRPTAFPLAVTLLVVISLVFLYEKLNVEYYIFFRFVFGGLFISSILILFLYANVINYLSINSHIELPTSFKYFMSAFESGNIIDARLSTYSPNPNGTLDFFFILVKRVIYFFSVTSSEFSLKHNAINVVFFIPAYFFAFISFYNLISSRESPIAKDSQWTLLICSLVIWLFAVFHSCILIDYDWRYRVPVLLPLIIMSSIGAFHLLNPYISRYSKIN